MGLAGLAGAGIARPMLPFHCDREDAQTIAISDGMGVNQPSEEQSGTIVRCAHDRPLRQR